jgi:hypothetical protein
MARIRRSLTGAPDVGKGEQLDRCLLEALKAGEEDLAAGRCRSYTPDLFAEIVENAKKKARAGRSPKGEVTP